MPKVYVIAPDKSSGLAFCDVLKKKDIEAEFNYHVIKPRVINNKITKSKDVIDDMNAIFRSFRDKTKSVVIACNTLQLWLPQVDSEYKKNVKIYTTFEACDWKYHKLKNKPIWLGTTPLVERTTSFPTLISSGEPEIQDSVQELIWRIKMLYGDDIQTAPEIVKRDQGNIAFQKAKIKKIKQEIIAGLKRLKVKNAIVGCTELPMIFANKEEGINFIDPASILAEYIKSQSVSIIFAGGTISSVANDRGLRIGGKAFDLLEKLNETTPGAYKNLNVTNCGVVYAGFSENMSLKDQNSVYESVLKELRSKVTRIVITHGTDAMEQTARYLDNKLRSKLIKSKTVVVLTGSNDHAGSKKTDAWNNLKLAINEGGKNIKGGVYVAFHNLLIPADIVAKEYFDGKEMNYIYKNSFKFKFGLKKYNEWKEIKKQFLINNYFKDVNRQVDIYEYSVNKIGLNHVNFLKRIKSKKPDAILFILYHSSTANVVDEKTSVALLIKKLTALGILCFGITENGDPTNLTMYRSSIELKRAGLVGI